MRRTTLFHLLIAALTILACTARPTPNHPTLTARADPTPAATHTTVPATPSHTLSPTATPIPTAQPIVERGQAPEGFSLITVAQEMPAITSIAFGPDGALYAGLRFSGIIRLVDTDGDRRYETGNLFAGDFDELLGLAWLGDTLYVSSAAQVTTLRDADGDAVAEARSVLIDNLPIGRHQNDSLVFGPDGRLYMPLGSTCDACQETNALNASILSFNPDGSDMQIVARGLRNAFDLAFNAQGQLFATDNGRDDLGPNLPPEELNYIIPGAHYGWPDCWGRDQGSNCENTQPPIAEFDARASADGIVFYGADQFPPEYSGDAFVALFGSYEVNVRPRVVRVQMQPAGDSFTTQLSDFVTGIGRPLDLAVGPDGALYIADYEAEAIFRVSYGGP